MDAAAKDAKQRSTIEALTKLYRLLTKLPYIDPECLMTPPETGWTTIDEPELHKRGKTKGAIELLRQLPYLKQKGNAEKWTVAIDALHINYAEGEMYTDWIEDVYLKVPGHVVWLTELADNNGMYWLLDTQTFEAIEFRPNGNNDEIDYEASEATPVDLKWTIQTRMPAAEYFNLWRHQLETLELMLIPGKPFRGTAECFQKLPQHLWEESLWPSDDEDDSDSYEENVDEQHASSDSGDAEDDGLEEEDADWEILQDTNELEWLEKDKMDIPFLPFGQFQHAEPQKPIVYPLEGCRRSQLFALGVPGQEIKEPPADLLSGPWIKQKEEVDVLLAIFGQCGWPLPPRSMSSISVIRPYPDWDKEIDTSGFDRDNCSSKLMEFMTARRAKFAEQVQQLKEDEEAANLQRLLFIRHRIQKILLQTEVTPSEEDLGQVAVLLDEVSSNFFDEQQVKASKVLKVITAALQLDGVSAATQFDLSSKMQAILQIWGQPSHDSDQHGQSGENTLSP